MNEENNLFFIPILAKALNQQDSSIAIRDALNEIIQLGKQPAYKTGYQQFEEFLFIGLQKVSEDADDFARLQDVVLTRLLVQLATNTFEGPEEVRDLLFKRIETDQELSNRYKKILEEGSTFIEDPPPLELELYHKDELLQVQALPTAKQKAIFERIEPGTYSIKLSNGRVIWEDNIEAKDVIWKTAFEDEAYPMAADTEADEMNPTKSHNILNGEIKLEVYAGLESGKIALSLIKKSKNRK